MAVLFLMLLSISLCSAWFPSVREEASLKDSKIISDTASIYPAISIKDWFGIGATEADLVITEHTSSCMTNCSSEWDISTYQDSPLIDDVRFYIDGVESSIKDYKFYVKTGDKETEVPEYETQCSSITLANGSEQQSCSQVQTGSHVEITPEWTLYNLGDSMPAGDYIMKIDGKKEAHQAVDWQIKSQSNWITDWAVWNSSFTDGLVHYWNCDEGTGTVVQDVRGRDLGSYQRNGTLSTGATFVTGIIGYACNTSEINAFNVTGYLNPNLGNMTWTLSFWINMQDKGSNENNPYGTIDSASSNQHRLNIGSNKVPNMVLGGSVVTGTAANNFGVWNLVTITTNATSVMYYVNGTLNKNGVVTPATDAWKDMRFGGITGSYSYRGAIDEIGIWNRTLSSGEVADLWNGGSGIAYSLLTPATLSSALNNPIAGFNTTSGTIIFNASCSATQQANITNATLYIGSSSYFNSTSVNGTAPAINYTWTVTKPEGSYAWTVKCEGIDNSFNTYLSSTLPANRTFTIDATAPTITIAQPTGNYYAQAKFSLNYTVVDSGVGKGSCWYSYNGGANTTLASCANASIAFNSLGTNNLTLYANDTLNNFANKSVTFEHYPAFALCNDTVNQTILNISFIDETSLLPINATINGLFNYYPDSNSADSQNYNYNSNPNSNGSYAFCINPSYGRIFLSSTVTYGNQPSYPNRQWTTIPNLYTNTTTNVTLYLLSTSDGIYSSFQITTPGGSTIPGATITIERNVSGVPTVIGTQVTDSAGIATFFLNINYYHTVTVTKAGYGASVVIIRPTQSSYTITLVPTTTGAYNNTINGVSWTRTPISGLLEAGVHNFSFNPTSIFCNIQNIRMDLVNATTFAIINSTNATCSCNCSISTIYDFEEDKMLGKYYVMMAGTSDWYMVEGDGNWYKIVTNTSSARTLKTFINYISDPSYWIGTPGGTVDYNGDDYRRYEFTKLVAFFLIFAIIMAYFNIQTQFDIMNPGIVLIGLPIFMWILSISGGILGQGFFYIQGATPFGAFMDNCVVALYATFIAAAIYFSTLRREG